MDLLGDKLSSKDRVYGLPLNPSKIDKDNHTVFQLLQHILIFISLLKLLRNIRKFGLSSKERFGFKLKGSACGKSVVVEIFYIVFLQLFCNRNLCIIFPSRSVLFKLFSVFG